jgi:predicted transcriptional regulator
MACWCAPACSSPRRGWSTAPARLTGRKKSNLSRTLETMAGYGLVHLERGLRGRIAPKVMHDRVELDLPLTTRRRAISPRKAS